MFHLKKQKRNKALENQLWQETVMIREQKNRESKVTAENIKETLQLLPCVREKMHKTRKRGLKEIKI